MYLEWLYKKIGSVSNRNPNRSHWTMVKKMYSTPFIPIIPNDDNRAADGLDLREEFLDEHDIQDESWLNQECSILEIAIVLAQILDFEADVEIRMGGVGGWFWQLMKNVGLDLYSDAVCNRNPQAPEEIERVLDIINTREYDWNGFGGFFPLHNPTKDQRRVELWYQLNEYLLDRNYVVT